MLEPRVWRRLSGDVIPRLTTHCAPMPLGVVTTVLPTAGVVSGRRELTHIQVI